MLRKPKMLNNFDFLFFQDFKDLCDYHTSCKIALSDTLTPKVDLDVAARFAYRAHHNRRFFVHKDIVVRGIILQTKVP